MEIKDTGYGAKKADKTFGDPILLEVVDKPGEQTTVYEDITFDVPIREETFSLRNLERWAARSARG